MVKPTSPFSFFRLFALRVLHVPSIIHFAMCMIPGRMPQNSPEVGYTEGKGYEEAERQGRLRHQAHHVEWVLGEWEQQCSRW